MTSARAIGPRVGMPREVVMPFTILALCWIPVAVAGLGWVSGRSASWLSGHGWAGPDFGWTFAVTLFTKGPGVLWPQVPVVLFGVVACLFGLGVGVPVGAVWVRWYRRRSGRPDDPLPSLARPADVAALAPAAATGRAVGLRPSLVGQDPKAIGPAECGILLGRLEPKGPLLRASWEDVILAVMAPRTGKTTAVAVPAVLDAPGAVVATGNKSDLYMATSALRAAVTGERAWGFDPQRIAYLEQDWWWNPLGGVTGEEEARRLAGHFIQEIRGDREREFWSSAAHDLLSALLLAAAVGARTLVDVYEWLNDSTVPTPVDLLAQHGHRAAAASVASKQAGAPETREGVYETARTAAQCLRNPQIMAWVTPPRQALPEFDPIRFVTSRQTLYLLSKDGAGGAAPLVAAFSDRLIRVAEVAAQARGGRLDPPMLVVLDEAANICRIGDLPELYSHVGSRGIVPVTILQSYRQGTRVWGEAGMDSLWSASTVKLVGAGIDDARFAEDISRLVGDHDIAVRSASQGDGRMTETVSLRRQRILAPDQVRALAKGRALLFATGCRAALVRLQPWFDGPAAARVGAAEAAAKAALTGRAQSVQGGGQ